MNRSHERISQAYVQTTTAVISVRACRRALELLRRALEKRRTKLMSWLRGIPAGGSARAYLLNAYGSQTVIRRCKVTRAQKTRFFHVHSSGTSPGSEQIVPDVMLFTRGIGRTPQSVLAGYRLHCRIEIAEMELRRAELSASIAKSRECLIEFEQRKPVLTDLE